MNKKIVDALESCLEGMEQGQALDSVLKTHPEYAAQLRPLLETAMHVRQAGLADLPATALARQRLHGLALAANLRTGRERNPLRWRLLRSALTMFSVIAILFMSGNGLLMVSAQAIPGDALYRLKRSVESTQLQLVSNPADRQALEQTFSERRVEEAKSLLAMQRIESVEFRGVVSSKSYTHWLVTGIPVLVTSQTWVDEGIQVGDEIDVDGSTDSSGSMVAAHLSLVATPDQDGGQPGAAPVQSTSPEGSEESGVTATATPTVVPAHSSEDSTQSSEDGAGTGDSHYRSSSGSSEHQSSDENTSTNSHDSDQHSGD